MDHLPRIWMQGVSMRLWVYLLSVIKKGMPSLSHWMMALRNHFLLATKSMLRTLKIFSNFCQKNGAPIVDWTVATKKAFDDFRCSQACMVATEKIDVFLLLLLPLLLSQSRKIS